MKLKTNLLLVIPVLALVVGGCDTSSNPGQPSENMLRPTFPSFTPDPSPDAPNFDWMQDHVFPYDDSEISTNDATR